MVECREEKHGSVTEYYKGEHVDCLDTVKKWCNAEVKEIDQANGKLFIHYTGFNPKYDDWIEVGGPRLLK